MSSFMNQKNMREQWEWNDIVSIHWNYLESEENVQKIETRQRLEEIIKEFVCTVRHDRKFFLPETNEVMKKSIRDLDGFCAEKAIRGFEAISQYANNLFTKPWRKEIRILKMYSGFYQHEIKSSLLEAEKLFEAMGYRSLSEHNTFILDVPICPDQVMNVSRDAMIAYVELQIIKQIHANLDAIKIHCSWYDIYRYREEFTGGITQAVKALAYSTDAKRFYPKHNAMEVDNYGYIDANYFERNDKFCPAHCQCYLFKEPASRVPRPPPPPPPRLTAAPSDMCSVPGHYQQSPITFKNSGYSNLNSNNPASGHYQSGAAAFAHMSQSRSLEYYSEPGHNHHNTVLQRHSFDHQQQNCTAASHQHNHFYSQHQPQYCSNNQPHQNFYEPTYDCIEGSSLGGGSSNKSYAALAGNRLTGLANSTYSMSYNVSRNRNPFPSQSFPYDHMQSFNLNQSHEPPYSDVRDAHMYSSIAKLQPNNMHCIQQSSLAAKAGTLQGQSAEQLISFEDSVPQHHDNLQQYRQNHDASSNHLGNQHHIMRNSMENLLPFQPKDDASVYAKPTPKESRKERTLSQTYTCNSEERGGDTVDMTCESNNDGFVNIPHQVNERNQVSSPLQFSKNQDGVGSAEDWNYVYKNLEQNSCSKSFDVRRDMSVNSSDFEKINIKDTSPSRSNSTEKRTSYSENEKNTITPFQQQQQKQSQLERQQKFKTLDNAKDVSKNNEKLKYSACATTSANVTQNQKVPVDNNTKRIKPVLKHTNETQKFNSKLDSNKTQQKTSDNKTFNKKMNNNNNVSSKNADKGNTERKASSKKSTSINSTKTSTNSTTQIIAAIVPDWNCIHCTFLNNNVKSICDMCCKSQIPLEIDSSTADTATRGRTMAQNTPTCV